jgi:hypothetical protein
VKTYGYDYAFALSLDAMNAILAARLAEVDMTLAYQAPDPDSGSTVKLDAKLGPWRIEGGQNSLLNISMPIESGRLSLTGGALTGDYDLGGVTPVMQITLGWLGPGGTQSAEGSGELTRLVFDPDPSTDKDNPGYVATANLLDPDKRLDTLASGLLSELMGSALFANREKVAQVFASVDPQPAALASWLRPSRWQYFVSEPDRGTAALCFLCQLDPAKQFPAQPAFDASALRPGADGVVLVSQATFFEHAVLPAVRTAFPGGDFRLVPDGESASIVSSGSFDAGRVSAQHYTLGATAAGDGLSTTASGSGPLKFLFGLADLPDASYSWSVATTNPAVYQDGRVSFAADPNPVIHHDQTVYWYDWVLLVALGITNAVGLAAAIYGLVNGFADDAQSGGTRDVDANLEASTGGAAVNLADLVDWTAGGRRLLAVGAGMSEALYVSCSLV